MPRSTRRLQPRGLAIVGTLFALIAMLAMGEAYACSCAPAPDIESAFEKAELVVVAQAVSVTQRRPHDDYPAYVEERATLRIVETLKGTKLPGDSVFIKSQLGPGPCGRSVRNSPTWIEEILDDGGTVPAAISDRWLIYALAGEGEEQSPLELSMCGRHNPVDFEFVEDELARLRELRDAATNEQERAKTP